MPAPLLAGMLALLSAPALAADVTIVPAGTTIDGQPVQRILLSNDRGMRVAIITYGATLTAIEVPDAAGRVRNVVLSLPDVPAQQRSARRWGAIIGRYAGRIADAGFVLDGVHHRLEPGRNGVTLHGGSNGYDSRLWTAVAQSDRASVGAVMSLAGPAGDQGFPGRLAVTVTYRLLRRANTLRIEYAATTDAPTVFNPTNHVFLNLTGAGNGTIANQSLQIPALRFAETDARKIPTGRLLPVAGTLLDFRQARAIGPGDDVRHPLLAPSNGYDHSYVLRDTPARRPQPVATLTDGASGRRLVIASTEPALQFNSGNGFDGTEIGSEGVAYPIHAGVALEPFHLPDSPNRPAFPTTIVRPGRAFHSVTEYRFSVTPAGQ